MRSCITMRASKCPWARHHDYLDRDRQRSGDIPETSAAASRHQTGRQDRTGPAARRPGMTITAATNVLVRAVMRDDPAQGSAAARLLSDAELIPVPLPCLCELVWVLRRVYGIQKATTVACNRTWAVMQSARWRGERRHGWQRTAGHARCRCRALVRPIRDSSRWLRVAVHRRCR